MLKKKMIILLFVSLFCGQLLCAQILIKITDKNLYSYQQLLSVSEDDFHSFLNCTKQLEIPVVIPELKNDNGFMYVDCFVNNVKMRLLVDVGSPFIVLTSSALNKVGINVPENVADKKFIAVQEILVNNENWGGGLYLL